MGWGGRGGVNNAHVAGNDSVVTLFDQFEYRSDISASLETSVFSCQDLSLCQMSLQPCQAARTLSLLPYLAQSLLTVGDCVSVILILGKKFYDRNWNVYVIAI